MTPSLWQRIKDWMAVHKYTRWWMDIWRKRHQRQQEKQYEKRSQD